MELRAFIGRVAHEAARNHGRRMFVLGIVVGAMIVAVFTHDNGSLSSRVTTLEHACVPMDTGGGVTQCAQPTRDDTAIRACLLNVRAYVGVTTEDTAHLFAQCIDDMEGR